MNFLVFMTDHQRGDTLARGSDCLTPNVDRIRDEAVRFTRAYCPAPHCCPSRATFFTGLYPSQHGVWNNVNVGNALSRGLYDGVRTIGEDFSDAGFDAIFSGKWHVSDSELPSDRGFRLLSTRERKRAVGNRHESSEWGIYEKGGSDDGTEPRREAEIVRPGYPRYTQYGVSDDPFGDRAPVDAACAELRGRKGNDSPFFMFVGPTGPHDPYIPPQEFLDMYPEGSIELPDNFDDAMDDKPALYRRTRDRYSQLTREEHRESRRRYYAFCTYEDYLFGKVLDALEQSGHADDTAILYVSDHGDYAGAHGLWAKGLPCFREAYDVCAMLRVPGMTRGAERSEFVSLADFAPTFLELAGIAPGARCPEGSSPDRGCAGKSLVPLLRGGAPSDWRSAAFTQTNGNEIYGIQRSVRTDEWKYTFNSFDYDELYDLRADPQELHNLIPNVNADRTEYAEVVRELSRLLWTFAHETRDNCVNPYIMTSLAPFGPGVAIK